MVEYNVSFVGRGDVLGFCGVVPNKEIVFHGRKLKKDKALVCMK